MKGTSDDTPTRFIGLDIHKEYLVASGVDHHQNQVFGPIKVTWGRFENWIQKNLDQRTRDIRALVSQRQKMVSLSTQAKNRLHAALHRKTMNGGWDC